jgi:hypothetical protein
MKLNLDEFKETLPYASELFGVYQPLLGWRSRITRRRVDRGRLAGLVAVTGLALGQVKPGVTTRGTTPSEGDLVPPLYDPPVLEVTPALDSCVARRVAAEIRDTGPSNWTVVLGQDMLNRILDACRTDIEQFFAGNMPAVSPLVLPYLLRMQLQRDEGAFGREGLLQRESKVAGYLHWLSRNHLWALDTYFFVPKKSLSEVLTWSDPLAGFGMDAARAVLSPIGIIHLFRQYFFELKSFLGNPVGHVWVSPGTTVELFEISTRKKVIERTIELATETTQRTQSESSSQDELSDAVREENKSDTRFGFTAEARYTVPTFEASANASLNLDSSRTTSRETTHKSMRTQSEKQSSEIKRSFKSTFRTMTEVQDSTSKRYVIQNLSDKLINYELRRKMRVVGVQAQDISTQLCWQVYVDDPGRDLGLAELVHVAQPPDFSSLQRPDAPVGLEPKTVEVAIQYAYENTPDSEGSEMDVIFYDGSDQEGGLNNNDRIVWKRKYKADPPGPGYTMDAHIDWLTNHTSVVGAEVVRVDQQGTFEVILHEVNFDDMPSIPFKITTRWSPPPISADAQKAYDDALAAYDAEKNRLIKEAYMGAIRERIKQASQIRPRSSTDMREEERTVVYRRLISQLMQAGDPKNRHVTTELIRSLFDVEKMLYFVAPEWWAPRLHQSHQSLSPKPLTAEDKVSWGGAGERPDNYYITDESEPAPFGASLGWLLQLDGDNMRNAFLNSPWVKAVIPIRPGKEMEALAWLQQAHVEGTDGLDALYDAPQEELDKITPGGQNVTILDALVYLAKQVAEQAKKASKASASPYDPTKNVLPTEMVFEHGFYPLQGSFKIDEDPLKVFTQWIEVLPTDQIVAINYIPEDHL